MELHHPIMSKLWDLGGRTKRKKEKKDKSDMEKKTNTLINYISDFNKIDIIQYNKKPISNILEEPHYISSMTPIGFMNGQDESRCYVNSSFQVLFQNLF